MPWRPPTTAVYPRPRQPVRLDTTTDRVYKTTSCRRGTTKADCSLIVRLWFHPLPKLHLLISLLSRFSKETYDVPLLSPCNLQKTCPRKTLRSW